VSEKTRSIHPGRYQAQINGEPRQSTSSGFTAQYKDNENKSPVSAFDEIRDAAYRPRLVDHRTKMSGRDVPHNDMQMQMFNAFKDVCTAASGSVRQNLLNEEYPNRIVMSFMIPWKSLGTSGFQSTARSKNFTR
jgi:hypothetical protein